MEQLIDIFQYEWAIRALIASSLVGILCGILGCFIVLRRMALIGDALSHAILPGVVGGFLVAGHSVLAFFTGSVIAGLVTAILITWLQRNVKTKDDAAIGIVFTAMFALGIMGISQVSRQEGVHLDMKDFLFGNVLGIADQDLWLTSLVAVFVTASVIFFYRYFFITTFQQTIAQTMGISVSTMHYFLMLLLSFAVVASLQSVGVILVVAMLIIPASTAYLLTNKLNRMIVISALLGLIAAIAGLVFAILIETTPGPAMTITSAFIYLLAVIFAPEKGVISRNLIRHGKQNRIFREDVLKQMVKLHEAKELSFKNLSARLNTSKRKLVIALGNLNEKALVQFTNSELEITQEGAKRAYELIRAHRMWETYLVRNMGMKEEQIHDYAEKYEHILTGEMVDNMGAKLGNPKLDPHGQPIPQKNSLLTLNLLHAGQHAMITTDQQDANTALKLWQLGITPNIPFSIKKHSDDEIEILLNDRFLKLDAQLAKATSVTVIE